MKNSIRFIGVIAALFAAASTSTIRASEHRDTAIAESSKPQAVAGGEKFSVALPYEKAFEAVVTALQKADKEVSDANKDSGLIATAIEATGGWHQTGTRTVVSVIRDGDTSTLIKVVVTEQKRYKALQVEPWGDAKLNASKTKEAVAALKTALGTK